MWAFFSARLRMWLVLAVGAPVLGWVLGRVGDAIEKRRGPSALTKVLQKGRDWLARRSRGPLSARRAAETTGPRDPGIPVR